MTEQIRSLEEVSCDTQAAASAPAVVKCMHVVLLASWGHLDRMYRVTVMPACLLALLDSFYKLLLSVLKHVHQMLYTYSLV